VIIIESDIFQTVTMQVERQGVGEGKPRMRIRTPFHQWQEHVA